MFKKILLSLLLFTATLYATTPTQDNTAKLYVAMFDRASDSAGLEYWVEISGLDLEGISQSFFGQDETQEKYPPGTTAEVFVTAVYANLFNRTPDAEGLVYWVEEIVADNIPRSLFVLAVINGAQGTDATIMNNKTAVAVAFAEAGLNDADDAVCVIADVTEDEASVADGLEKVARLIEGKPCINNDLTADAGVDQHVKTGSLVMLDGSNSHDVNHDPLTYSWTMTSSPAGSTVVLSDITSSHPTFTPDVDGNYIFQLIVNNGTVSSVADTVTVTATHKDINAKPVADAGSDQHDKTGSLVTLDGSKSHDADGHPLTYGWTIIDKPGGSSATLLDPSSVHPTFTPDVDGDYVIELIVKDGMVESDPSKVTVSAKHVNVNTAPVADAGNDQDNINPKSLVTLDGSGSHDKDGDTLTYSWTIQSTPTGSQIKALTKPASVNPTFTPDAGGAYVLKLIVNDGTIDSKPSTVSVHVLIIHNGTTYGTVSSPNTNKVWLDKNLGAAQVCTAFDDAACYGDYYQWGRNADGHQVSSSGDGGAIAGDVDNAGTDEFIKHVSSPYDWASVDGSGATRATNWSATDGSSVCPIGYRVPTEAELTDETTGASPAVANNADAFNSFLKLPTAGNRNYYSGSFHGQGSYGNIWSVSTDSSYTRLLYFRSSDAGWSSDARAYGHSVRCLKD